MSNLDEVDGKSDNTWLFFLITIVYDGFWSSGQPVQLGGKRMEINYMR